MKCGINIETDHSFPLNKLYYEVEANYNRYLRRKDYYESPPGGKVAENELNVSKLRYEEKCLNPFCLRPKFYSEDSSELFCSIGCRKDHEELYVD